MSAAAAKSLQSCPTLCNPKDSSPPDSSVYGISQARILESVAISFSNEGVKYVPKYNTALVIISSVKFSSLQEFPSYFEVKLLI